MLQYLQVQKMRQEEPCSRDNMPWAGACKQAYARLSSAEPRGKSLKTMSLNIHKESSEVPLFGMKPEILVSQSTILWQAFSSQLSESQSSGNRLAMQRKMDQASWVFLLVRWKACWRGGGQFCDALRCWAGQKLVLPRCPVLPSNAIEQCQRVRKPWPCLQQQVQFI